MDESLETIIATATPGKLIVMLYARALKDLKDACDLYDLTGDPRSQTDAIHLIVHAQQIVSELNNCLNKDKNNELAANLKRIYEYIQYRLAEAISKCDKEPLVEVISLMTELHNTWETMLGSINKLKGE
jgi:flagellar protein FliS